MSRSVNTESSSYYGVIRIHPENPVVELHNDEETEERADAPRLELPHNNENVGAEEFVKLQIGAAHHFFRFIAHSATRLFESANKELDRILIKGPSPMKYDFHEGEYLGELHDMAVVKNTRSLDDHPITIPNNCDFDN
jgi:peptide subunit release factor 1 (eRF1)